MIYTDFMQISILVPEVNEKQNLGESYKNKYQKHVARSYRYKLVCVDDKFSVLSYTQLKMLFTIY